MAEWINIGRPGPFGNQFVIGRDGDRAEVVRKDAEWIRLPAQAALRRRIRLELHGKKLFCPGCRGSLPCHRTVREEIAAECCEGLDSHEWDCRLTLDTEIARVAQSPKALTFLTRRIRAYLDETGDEL